MTASTKNTRVSFAMEMATPWIQSQGIPADVVVKVGDANFSLHKFMLVAKSNYIRKLVRESRERDVTRVDLSDIPGGPATFEKAAEFCYGVNFEITVQNVAALHCAAVFLQMTDHYCNNNLAGRTDEFLSQVGLSSLSSSVTVLKSCNDLLPIAEELKIVDRCIEVASSEACKEANFPSRSPTNWWMEELIVLDVTFFGRIIRAMRARGAKPEALVGVIMTYAGRTLRYLVRDHSGNGTWSLDPTDPDLLTHQSELVESFVALLPLEKATFPVNFLCCLLRCAIFVKASMGCKKELEKRITAILDHVTVDDLMVLSCAYDGERLLDLESVRRIISAFVEKEKSVAVFDASNLTGICSSAMRRVANIVDVYLGEIATYGDLGISKFIGFANLMPREARKVDDDLYQAVDIYLKAHPNLSEIEQEKVCRVMDPLKLSHKARLHVSGNKRLPVQIVLHILYNDQLKLRSGTSDSHNEQDSMSPRSQVLAEISHVKENEELRSELTMMRMYMEDLRKSQGEKGLQKWPRFFSSMSKILGKLNPFRHGSKDTSYIVDDSAEVKKLRSRRFSIS